MREEGGEIAGYIRFAGDIRFAGEIASRLDRFAVISASRVISLRGDIVCGGDMHGFPFEGKLAGEA